MSDGHTKISKRQSILAIIPARGGSKRIPRKNIAPLAGKPLLAYSIEHALQARQVNRTIVSTDDDEIAEIARQYGAEVVMRPPELATDTATSEDALLHVMDHLEEKENFPLNMIAFLQCTSPLRQPHDIDSAISTFVDKEADSLFSAFRFNKYIWRLNNGIPVSLNYDYRKRWREQDFPCQYQENGSIYIFKPWVLRKLRNRLGGKIAIYEMDYLSSIQVDTSEDLLLCEWVLERRRKIRG